MCTLLCPHLLLIMMVSHGYYFSSSNKQTIVQISELNFVIQYPLEAHSTNKEYIGETGMYKI